MHGSHRIEGESIERTQNRSTTTPMDDTHATTLLHRPLSTVAERIDFQSTVPAATHTSTATTTSTAADPATTHIRSHFGTPINRIGAVCEPTARRADPDCASAATHADSTAPASRPEGLSRSTVGGRHPSTSPPAASPTTCTGPPTSAARAADIFPGDVANGSGSEPGPTTGHRPAINAPAASAGATT